MNSTDHDTPSGDVAHAPLGARLRAAREARSMSVAEVAAALHAPLRVVEAVEADQLDRLGAPVFSRGYLLSYAKLVGVPTAVVDVALAREQAPHVPLRSAVHMPRSRFLLERYARKGAYLVLTVSIVLPVVWLATQDQLPVQQLGLRSLEAPMDPLYERSIGGVEPSVSADGAADEEGMLDGRAPGFAGPALVPADEGDVTVMASMASFYGQRAAAARAAGPEVEPTVAAAPVASSADGWQLRLQDDSWVEIIDVDGRKLAFGLLRAGSEHRYPAGRVARVALGNASAVELLRDGAPVDFTPFQRANVVRFAVSSDGQLRPTGS
jgi:cytoskeleton protein RodZ